MYSLNTEAYNLLCLFLFQQIQQRYSSFEVFRQWKRGGEEAYSNSEEEFTNEEETSSKETTSGKEETSTEERDPAEQVRERWLN